MRDTPNNSTASQRAGGTWLDRMLGEPAGQGEYNDLQNLLVKLHGQALDDKVKQAVTKQLGKMIQDLQKGKKNPRFDKANKALATIAENWQAGKLDLERFKQLVSGVYDYFRGSTPIGATPESLVAVEASGPPPIVRYRGSRYRLVR